MTAEVHGPVQAAGQNVRQVVAMAVIQQGLAGRQLSTLRNTYPAWDIDREQDASGQVWWIARLCRPVTADMAAAGVQPTVRQPDAIALAATLAFQSALLYNARSRTGPL
ncbi:hypothetical protein [Nonomuraea sp. SYSU D8015]|uniref:hypothetical protein n=1 Tax=Nonomuraea sp. SYSU D8015 TaxID=2593644 RepID=UPI001660C3E8|nr:hypothetical protein [Nonomuraea sp. SYSU D8015]